MMIPGNAGRMLQPHSETMIDAGGRPAMPDYERNDHPFPGRRLSGRYWHALW